MDYYLITESRDQAYYNVVRSLTRTRTLATIVDSAANSGLRAKRNGDAAFHAIAAGFDKGDGTLIDVIGNQRQPE